MKPGRMIDYDTRQLPLNRKLISLVERKARPFETLESNIIQTSRSILLKLHRFF